MCALIYVGRCERAREWEYRFLFFLYYVYSFKSHKPDYIFVCCVYVPVHIMGVIFRTHAAVLIELLCVVEVDYVCRTSNADQFRLPLFQMIVDIVLAAPRSSEPKCVGQSSPENPTTFFFILNSSAALFNRSAIINDVSPFPNEKSSTFTRTPIVGREYRIHFHFSMI